MVKMVTFKKYGTFLIREIKQTNQSVISLLGTTDEQPDAILPLATVRSLDRTKQYQAMRMLGKVKQTALALQNLGVVVHPAFINNFTHAENNSVVEPGIPETIVTEKPSKVVATKARTKSSKKKLKKAA